MVKENAGSNGSSQTSINNVSGSIRDMNASRSKLTTTGFSTFINFSKLNDMDYSTEILYAALVVFPKMPANKRHEFLFSLLRESCPVDMDFLYECLPRLHRDFIRLLPAKIAYSIITMIHPKDICTMCQVSKSWRKVCHSPELWNQLYKNIGLASMIDHYYNKQSPMKNNAKRLNSLGNWVKGHFRKRIVNAHSLGILGVSLHKSRWIATASADKTAKLFDLTSGICIRTFVGHELSVGCVQLDSAKIVTGSADTTVKIWSVRDGNCVATLQGHEKAITCLKFSQNTLITASLDKRLKIWVLNERTTAPVVTQYYAAQFKKMEAEQLLGQSSGTTGNSSNLTSTSSLTDSSTSSLHTSKDYSMMNKELQIREAMRFVERNSPVLVSLTATCIRTLHGHAAGVKCFDFYGHLLVSGDTQGTLKIWHVQSGNCLHTLDTNQVIRNPSYALSLYNHDLARPKSGSKSRSSTATSTSFDPISCVHFNGSRLVFGKFSGTLFMYECKPYDTILLDNQKSHLLTAKGSSHMAALAGTSYQYDTLKRYVEDPTSFKLLHVYDLTSGQAESASDWVLRTTEAGTEDQKMSFKKHELTLNIPTSAPNASSAGPLSAGATGRRVSMLPGIFEESAEKDDTRSSVVRNRRTLGPLKTNNSSFTETIVDKGMDVVKSRPSTTKSLKPTRTWALCVKLDAWRLMCGGSEGRFVLWNHREARKMKALSDTSPSDEPVTNIEVFIDASELEMEEVKTIVKKDRRTSRRGTKVGLKSSTKKVVKPVNQIDEEKPMETSHTTHLQQLEHANKEDLFHEWKVMLERENTMANNETKHESSRPGSAGASHSIVLPHTIKSDIIGKSITGVSFDDRFVVAVSMDGSLRIWDCHNQD